jgi:YVTN family beta-propeller protein
MRISRPKPYTWFAITLLLSVLFSSSARGVEELYRSPTDLLLSRDETQILTTNATAGTVSLIDRMTGAVRAELPCGTGPYALAHSADRTQVVVTARDSRELLLFKWEDGQISRAGAVTLASEPHGVAMTGDGAVAYVALRNEGVVAVIDLSARSITDRIAVGSWPTHLALSRDSRRLAVAVHGECGIAVIDTVSLKRDFLEDFQGINFGHLRVSPDDQFVYFPWMVYRRNPISKSNIRQGWVLASRVARVDLREHKRRDAIALDPQGEAVADPHGLDLSTDGQRMVVTASGTHELLVYRVEGLPFQDYGGPGDHIDAPPGGQGSILSHPPRWSTNGSQARCGQSDGVRRQLSPRCRSRSGSRDAGHSPIHSPLCH